MDEYIAMHIQEAWDAVWGGGRRRVRENPGRGPRQNAQNPIPLDRGVQFLRLKFWVPLYT